MTFEVRDATEADRPALISLLREMIPRAEADARLAWLYERNPAGRALTWIAFERGQAAGCTSYFPFRVQLDGNERLCALGGDGYVRPDFRRRGLGALLHETARSAMTDHGIGCMFGAPGAMNLTPLKHGGSREVGHVARWVRPIGGEPLGVRHPVLDRAIRRALRPRFAPRLDPMVPHDPRVDEIWQAVAPTIRLGTVRDAAFYTWRFLETPSLKEPAFVVERRGRPVAACALEMMRGGEHVNIVDLIAVPGAWHAALSAIARHVAASAAQTVDIKLMATDGRRRAVWRAGFFERESKPFLVVIPKDGDHRFLDPMRWFYGGADSDIDALD